MSINVRLATMNDTGDIARVHTSSWRSTYRGIVADSFLDKIVARYESGESQKLRERSVEKGGCYVASVESQVVGFVDGGANRFPEYPYESEIYAIYIEKEFQGRGVGRALFNYFIEDYLIPKQMFSLSIHVLKKNPSAAFYRKMGGTFFLSKWEDVAEKHLEIEIYGWNDVRL